MDIDVEELYLPNGIYRYDIEINTMRATNIALMDINFNTVNT